ncbi:MAG: hypothetical protein FWD84_07445, partial [Oscillospiraceae bacterium]|nr:hypothetical protein [Oscillospiraceae bacterium]
ELHFMFQHGVSRRAAFTAFVVHILVLSGFYAVVLFGVNHLLSFVNELLGASMNIQIVFNSVFSGYLDGLGTVPTAIISILFYWVMLLAAGTIGYLFTILFYRLNKLARTILIGAPIAFVVFLPLINVIVDGRIFAFFARLFQWFFGDYANPNPLNGIAFMTVFALLGLTGCFLLIRRIKLKKA